MHKKIFFLFFTIICFYFSKLFLITFENIDLTSQDMKLLLSQNKDLIENSKNLKLKGHALYQNSTGEIKLYYTRPEIENLDNVIESLVNLLTTFVNIKQITLDIIFDPILYNLPIKFYDKFHEKNKRELDFPIYTTTITSNPHLSIYGVSITFK